MRGEDMGNEQGKGGTIFGMAARTEPAGRAPPEVNPTTQPEKGKEKRPWSKKVKFALAGTALAAILGGPYADIEAVQGNIPGIHRSVDEFVPAPVQGLKEIPPGRENIQDNLPPTNIEGELPEIKPYIQQFKLGGVGETQFAPFPSVFTFRLKYQPSITEKIKVFNPEHPEGTMIETTTSRLPNVYMQGYVLAKEQSPDGSVLIALGIPKDENKLFSNEDLDKPGATQIDTRVSEDGISNIIVWLRIPNFADYQQPLGPQLGWSAPDKNGIRSVIHGTTDPNEIFKYIRAGDAVFAGGYDPPYPEDKSLDTLQQNFQQGRGKVSFEEAKQQYLDLGGANATTVREMLEDVKTGGVSLRKQLKTKRYIINVDYLKFVVGN